MRPNHSDKRMEPAADTRPRRVRNSESGQAATEFALILIPLLIVVGGIIYFGIGLNYWLDMNRVANQGARWAAVNYWAPYCLRTDNPNFPYNGQGCNTTNQNTACGPGPVNSVLGSPTTNPPYHSRARLQDVLRCQTRSPNTTPKLCYPGVPTGTEERGDPVKVRLMAPYKFWFVNSVGITLTATATMRLEQEPSNLVVTDPNTC